MSEPASNALRVPLRPGDGVGHWRLARLHEERFDVAERPMAGAMDPAFFLTRQKNYIPHEYPCRTEFAARYRGKRPEPMIGFEPTGWHFPFGSSRVELSGFWFRPTRVECWASTTIDADRAGTAPFRLATCGGTLLLVNGVEAAFLAGYRRNLEEAIEAEVELRAGPNTIEVWFGDLCERDTRYYFELSLMQGEGLAVALPVPVEPARAAEIGDLLEGMRFERPSFRSGEVALIFPRAASVEYNVSVVPSGEPDRAGAHTLAAGERRLVIGTVKEVPAGFGEFAMTIGDGDFRLTRSIAAEICDPRVAAEAAHALIGRAHEALGHVAERGGPGAVRVLALLALGQGGPQTDTMLAEGLPAIADCHDCADFELVPLLWCRLRYAEAIAPALREEIDAAILGFRYWLDEPGNDVMWFFSENHALLFHAACYLAGALFPEARFQRSGRLGSEQRETGRERLIGWFDSFERDEMAEWNSAPYFPIDFKGLAALRALAPDADIRARAERAILRLLEIVAASSHQGMLTASQGRSYEHSLIPARTLELSAVARLFFGRGFLGREFHALALLALCVRDYGLTTDKRFEEIACWQAEEALEWTFRQGPSGLAALYHYKTRDHAMGSVADYRSGEWGYQETVLHLRLGDRPEAQIWINHPGESTPTGHGRPSYWGGCGMLPRVHQYRDLAVLDFDAAPEQVDFTHAWLPEAELDEVRLAGERALVRGGNGLGLLIGSAPFQRIGSGPSAGCELRLPGRRSRWIVRLSSLGAEGDLDTFARRFAALQAENLADGAIRFDDPDYGVVLFRRDGRFEGEGRVLDPAEWTRAGKLLQLASPSPGGEGAREAGG